MSKEIIAAVRELEEAKGIDGEVLLTALEDALLAAYKKTHGAVDHARVVLDRDSGDIHVHAILLDEEAFRAHPGVHYPDPEELEAAAEEAPSEVPPRASPPSPSSPSRSSTGTQFDPGRRSPSRTSWRATSAASPRRPPSRSSCSASARPSAR